MLIGLKVFSDSFHTSHENLVVVVFFLFLYFIHIHEMFALFVVIWICCTELTELTYSNVCIKYCFGQTYDPNIPQFKFLFIYQTFHMILLLKFHKSLLPLDTIYDSGIKSLSSSLVVYLRSTY